MSYNVDSTETLVLDASMRAKDVMELLEDNEDESFLPEINFLDEMRKDAKTARRRNPDTLIPLPNFWWSGMGANDIDVIIDRIAPKIVGEVQVIFTWERGDSVSGLAIKDGKAKRCDVIQTLKLPDGW
jgi:hypothetical protein